MIDIIVNGTEIYGKLDTKLTSGSVGRGVKFVFDSTWDGLLKTAVFKVGDDSKDWYLGEGDECQFPWELLTHNKVGQPASIGVCGMRGEDIVYPTIYTYIGELAQGANTSDDPSIPPTPELVQQFINLVEESKQIAQSVRDDADSGVFDGDAANTDQVFDAKSENAQSGVAISNYFASKIVNNVDVVNLLTCESGVYLTSKIEYVRAPFFQPAEYITPGKALLVVDIMNGGHVQFMWFSSIWIISGISNSTRGFEHGFNIYTLQNIENAVLNNDVVSKIEDGAGNKIPTVSLVMDYVNETIGGIENGSY